MAHIESASLENRDIDKTDESFEESVAEYVETTEELKRFMAENKIVLTQIKDMRRRLAELKTTVMEMMEESGVDNVTAGGLVVELKPSKRVKHDVTILKRLAGESLTDEDMQGVTETANVIRIGRPKKKMRENN